MAEEKGKPLTREDVLKLIKENGGKAEGLDLSGKEFAANIDLRRFNLRGIILKKAVFKPTFVRPLSSAHLEEADLSEAHLEGANLWYAHLEKANLFNAHLEGAYLGSAHLEGAYLFGAKLSPDEALRDAGLRDAALEDANWGKYILGEEKEDEFDLAADTYRRLKIWYTNAGMYDIAAKFYYREKEASRKGARRWKDRAAGWLSWAVFGHGEGWKRLLFGWIVGVIFVLAAAYYFLGSFSSSSFWDTLYYSATSFSALGYSKWAPQPTGWAKGMGAAEAIIGVFMMALLLVTFVRKWTR